MINFYKTPFLVKKLWKTAVWNIKNSNQSIYLTFDDGPTPEITYWILAELEKWNAKATFFCVGKNVEKHPEIFHNIRLKGHLVGNHTFSHENGWKTTSEQYVSSIERCSKVVKSNLFRPPYGKITPKQIQVLKQQYKIVMWDILSYDFDTNLSPETCCKNCIKNIKNGSIIVFHDNRKASKNIKYVLPKILEYYTQKGYFFKGIPL